MTYIIVHNRTQTVTAKWFWPMERKIEMMNMKNQWKQLMKMFTQMPVAIHHNDPLT